MDVTRYRAEVLARPLEFRGTETITWEYDCRICMNERTSKYSTYRVHAGELVRCLPDWNYAHAWHTPEEFDRYVDLLADRLARGANF